MLVIGRCADRADAGRQRLCTPSHPADPRLLPCGGADLISDFNPIEEMLEIGRVLSHIDERIVRNEHVSADELVRLACDLHAIWHLDADACLGYARLHKFGRPSICHTSTSPLIAAELAAANGMDRFQIINVIGGALTMNLPACAARRDARQRDRPGRNP